ncbi:glutaminyl-peptide cyclotransferase [Sphingomonas sp.]|uniref:glutaminyl-peptide cyclotransferase n=1 Tax=Sphingomonas sp. TaxID=28214 RepID=UPI002DD61C05|nr:glutaminyl-peptide cyclotransferase [Sphingomonas sp.]
MIAFRPLRAALALALPAALLGAAAPQAVQPAPTPQTAPAPQAAPVPLYRIEVVARFPHDPRAFTQGLLWHAGHLYESTGKEGRSEVRRVALADGRVLARRAIPADQFGEGLALWKTTLVSLTWTHGIAHRWNVASLKPEGARRYPGEGWGLTTLDDSLVLSDGTSALRFLDPDTLAERRRVSVTVRGRPLDQLNELEVIDGQVYANVWQTDYIVAIDPADGRVTRIIDAGALRGEVAPTDSDAVLNGIAWDAKARRMFVTGKLWPTLFEVKLVPAV